MPALHHLCLSLHFSVCLQTHKVPAGLELLLRVCRFVCLCSSTVPLSLLCPSPGLLTDLPPSLSLSVALACSLSLSPSLSPPISVLAALRLKSHLAAGMHVNIGARSREVPSFHRAWTAAGTSYPAYRYQICSHLQVDVQSAGT